jgi:hypothetical protein
MDQRKLAEKAPYLVEFDDLTAEQIEALLKFPLRFTDTEREYLRERLNVVAESATKP